jgi:tetratricopeptide (TPR) repeat protein
VHGRVDHEGLGISMHQVGYCLSSLGRYEEARTWFERAVAAKQKGDVDGRVYRESLSITLRAGAECLRKLGDADEADVWEQMAQ